MRVPITEGVDPVAVTDAIAEVVGRPVAVTTRAPGQSDSDGTPLPGMVVVLDADTGRPLHLAPDVAAEVTDAVTAHDRRRPQRQRTSPVEVLHAALTTATTVTDLKTALLAYANALTGRERTPRRP